MCQSPDSKCLRYSIFTLAWSALFVGYAFRNCISPIVDVLEKDLNTTGMYPLCTYSLLHVPPQHIVAPIYNMLRSTATGVGMLSSFALVFYALPQIAAGILLQFVPAKYVLAVSAISVGCASILFSFSTNLVQATICSALGGLGASPSFLCNLPIIEDLFTRAQVPFAIGIKMTLVYGGLFLVNYLQAEIYERYGDWRIVFLTIGVFAWLSGIFLFIFVKCRDRAQRRMQMRDIGDGEILSKSAREMRTFDHDQTRLLSKHSSTDSHMKLNKKVKVKELCHSLKKGCTLKLNWLLALWGWCGMCLVNGFVGLWFISFLMEKYRYSRGDSALISGSFYLCRGLAAPFYGRLAMKLSKRKILLVVSSLLWICMLVIIYVMPDGSPMMLIIGLNVFAGIGGGSWGIMWTLQREYNAYYNCKDMAAGFINTFQQTAGVVGQLFVGEMLDMRWKMRDGDIDEDGVRKYTVGDYNYALLLYPVVVLIGIVSSCLLKETNGNNLDYSQYDTKQSKDTDKLALVD